MGKQGLTKVLIVDDEPDVCFLFGRILLKRNLKTGFAKNLEEAARYLETEPSSLVFLDNNLPDGQGIDFIPYLKSNYPEMRVVIVTANDSLLDKKKAYQQGADYFLGKPLSVGQIDQTLNFLEERGMSGTFPVL